jgi:hypothetical protein
MSSTINGVHRCITLPGGMTRDLRQLGLIERDRQGTDVVVQMVRRPVPGIGTMSPGTGLLDVRKVV